MVIEVRQLRYFQAVAEELHFSRAAQRLRIAQPALSRQIRRLEEDVGTLLLKRSQCSVELTAAGAVYLERARRILDELARASADARRTGAGEYGCLRFGFIHSSSFGLVPAILGRFRRRYPDVELDLREMTIAEQIEALPRGVIDLGLLRPPVGDPGIEAQAILEERFLLAVPSGHRLAACAGEAVSLQSLAGELFILFSQRHSPLFHARIVATCEKAGFVPRVVQHATQIHTVTGLVSAGLGIALVPEGARNLSTPGVEFVEIAHGPAPVEVALAWRRGDGSSVLRSFRVVARQVARHLRDARPDTP